MLAFGRTLPLLILGITLSELRKYVFNVNQLLNVTFYTKYYHFPPFLESCTILLFFGGHLGFGSNFESFYSHNGTL